LYASWLVDEPELSQQVVPHIVRSTQAVNDLFNSLFAFSGLNTEVTKVDWQEVDLAELLADLHHQYMPLARARGLQLRLRQRSCVVSSDPVLLRRLLGNLISNALKNTHQGGVVLALRVKDDRWRIDVSDTGVGIDAEHQKAIFKEFYRVPRQGTEAGFGLGLAIVSRLSHVMGLRVQIRSRPGRGSVFWVEGS
jgi:signal transduction histidine kinase